MYDILSFATNQGKNMWEITNTPERRYAGILGIFDS